MAENKIKKIKILFLITSLDKGGAETQFFRLISNLNQDENYELKIVSIKGGYFEEEFRKQNIYVENLSNKLNYLELILYINKLKKIILEFKPDIVHSFLFHTNILSKFMLFFMKKEFKLICSYRSVIKQLFWIRKLEYINMSKADMLISNSNAANSDLEIYSKYKIKKKVIYNNFEKKSIDLNQVKLLKPQFKNKKIILTVANFRSEKDYTTNVLTCMELSKIRDDFIFVYVGNPGPELKVIQKLIKKHNLENFIINLGKRNDVLELLAISDCFFMPTLFESQSNSIMEAMYMKVPIVTTNVAANKELVKKGYLCDLRDYNTMAKRINTILDGKYDKKWLKVNYTFLEDKFSLNIVTSQYRKVYKQILFPK